MSPVLQLRACGAEHAVNGLRGQNRSGRGGLLDAFGNDNSLAVQVAVVLQHLPSLQPDPQLHWRVGPLPVLPRKRTLNFLCTGDRAPSGLKSGDEAVAGVLEHRASMFRNQLRAALANLALDGCGRHVPEPLVKGGRADQVGTHDSDRALGEQLAANRHGR